jgi:uncharacterized repeat protein (TIGR03803 family)
MKRYSIAAMFVVIAAASPAFAQYALQTLATFNGTNGNEPEGTLLLSGSTLYGTTTGGGASSDGTIFSVPVAGGGTPTDVGSFNGTDGAGPASTVLLSGTTLYGATGGGGAHSDGTVFSEPISGGTPTAITSFNGTDGSSPDTGLVLSGSTFYGQTAGGGTNSSGLIYSVGISGGIPTVLGSLPSGTSQNSGPLALSGSTLYGASSNTPQYGELFSEPTSGGTPTTVETFTLLANPGKIPNGGVILSSGTLYGTTIGTGPESGFGTIYSAPISGGSRTALAEFNGTNGSTPEGTLLLSGTTLYGTTLTGGAFGDGVVFSVPVTGGTITDLVSFDDTDGENPFGGLIMDSNGDIFGTTSGGGANNDGTVFALMVPEPASATLLAAGSLLLFRRNRRKPAMA